MAAPSLAQRTLNHGLKGELVPLWNRSRPSRATYRSLHLPAAIPPPAAVWDERTDDGRQLDLVLRAAQPASGVRGLWRALHEPVYRRPRHALSDWYAARNDGGISLAPEMRVTSAHELEPRPGG